MSLHEVKSAPKPRPPEQAIAPGTSRLIRGVSACEGVAMGRILKLSGTDHEWD